MSTANSTSSTRASAGMLSCCVSVRWSYSGAALRSSSGTDSSVELSVKLGDGVAEGVSMGATLRRTKPESVGSGVDEVTVAVGTCTLCDGNGCSGEGVDLAVLGVELGVFECFG